MVDPRFAPVVELVERQRGAGLHDGAQLAVLLHDEVLVHAAVGESAPGRALQPDDVMMWYSSSKPLTAVAVLQLWERGRLGLDDRIGDHLDGWGAGKERCTVRHVLTHTGGFPMYRVGVGDQRLDLDETVARIAAHPAEYEPGTRAGYHLTTGWTVLGAVVEAVDGRRIDRYLQEEVLEPAGMHESRLGVPVEVQEQLGDRLAPVHWKGHALPRRGEDGRVEMVPYRVDRVHNEPWYRAKVEPGANVQGPAIDLARFYQCLLGHGPTRLLDPRTVEVMVAVHRVGMRDLLFGNMKLPWGLGVQTSASISGGPGRRAFGHGGLASSRGLADPELGLAFAFVANGLPGPTENERRMYEVTDAVYTALGEVVGDDEVARVRRPSRPPVEATYSS